MNRGIIVDIVAVVAFAALAVMHLVDPATVQILITWVVAARFAPSSPPPGGNGAAAGGVVATATAIGAWLR